jgi:scavenger receptor class B, member 1
LKPGSKSYEYWKSPPQPLYLDVYLFNWTNPEDINDSVIKPVMKEIGPFRFQEIPQKVNVKWHDHNSTVSYRKQSQYIFIPDQSKGNLDDMITSVNVIALVSDSIQKFSMSENYHF